ncbi:MAG: twin-arginine translocase TatA/TatE family subunit [Thermoanaerobaculia bacterium]|nr:twin-arginine translocase TatA/TatE family subunit [Thermoanaerobaculia bacterium]
MFGPLGFPELMFLLVLALLIFGPKKLPEIGRTLGKGLSEFRKASNELKRTINAEMEDVREADPRRLLRDEPPRRPVPKKTIEESNVEPNAEPSPETSEELGPETNAKTSPDDRRVARGEHASPAAAEPDGAPEATPATVAEIA